MCLDVVTCVDSVVNLIIVQSIGKVEVCLGI